MNNRNRLLKRELKQAGAKSPEIDQLAAVASELKLLKPTGKAAGHRQWARVLKPVSLAASSLLIGVVIAILAQSVTPTSWLYPVQKFSDAVAVRAHPEYRASVMMRRAQQVNELVKSHAPPSVILATLDSYKVEAADYKTMPHANYAAFDYCKTNLEQAAFMAPAGVRHAIASSLESLDAT